MNTLKNLVLQFRIAHGTSPIPGASPATRFLSWRSAILYSTLVASPLIIITTMYDAAFSDDETLAVPLARSLELALIFSVVIYAYYENHRVGQYSRMFYVAALCAFIPVSIWLSIGRLYPIERESIEDLLTPLWYAVGVAQGAAYAGQLTATTLARIGLTGKAKILEQNAAMNSIGSVYGMTIRTVLLYAIGQLVYPISPVFPFLVVFLEVVPAIIRYRYKWTSYVIRAVTWLVLFGLIISMLEKYVGDIVDICADWAFVLIDANGKIADDYREKFKTMATEQVEITIGEFTAWLLNRALVSYLTITVPTTLTVGQLFRIAFVSRHLSSDQIQDQILDSIVAPIVAPINGDVGDSPAGDDENTSARNDEFVSLA